MAVLQKGDVQGRVELAGDCCDHPAKEVMLNRMACPSIVHHNTTHPPPPTT
jgi:hypothetical protein